MNNDNVPEQIDEIEAELPALTELPALKLLVPFAMHGERLDKFISDTLKLDPEFQGWQDTSRVRVQDWIRAGQVLVTSGSESRTVIDTRYGLKGGDELMVTPRESEIQQSFRAQDIAFEVIYEDDDVAVINKHAGLVVHPAAGNWSGTLMNGLLFRYPEVARLPRAGLVHRLDKLTSGVLVVAKNLHAQNLLINQLQDRSMKRRYLAFVWGTPPEKGKIDQAIARHPTARTKMAIVGNGKPALTYYQVLGWQESPTCALLRCDLATGRTHQIRVHLEHVGFPLLGDVVYAGRMKSQQNILPRQALHAQQIGFIHPRNHKHLQFRASVPDDLLALADRLDLRDAIDDVS